MQIIKLDVGTTIYLEKKPNFNTLSIKPDKILNNDSLYVKYDYKINSQIIIPKGTRVIGDWVTESVPEVGAQLQVKQIFLCDGGQEFLADSDFITSCTFYNNKQTKNASHLYNQYNYKSVANINRRIVNIHSKPITLPDSKLNTIYIEIPVDEIPVHLIKDFVPYPCL